MVLLHITSEVKVWEGERFLHNQEKFYIAFLKTDAQNAVLITSSVPWNAKILWKVIGTQGDK